MIVQRTKTYAVCPSCGADAGCVDHLLKTETKTLWYCDSCGGRYALTFHLSGAVVIEKAQGRRLETFDLLVLEPQTKPVYFVVKGIRVEGEPWQHDEEPDAEQGHKQYYYEEHSCPINWLEPEVVAFDGDYDPHGLLKFLAWRDVASFPPKESVGPNARDRALEAFIESATASLKENS